MAGSTSLRETPVPNLEERGAIAARGSEHKTTGIGLILRNINYVSDHIRKAFRHSTKPPSSTKLSRISEAVLKLANDLEHLHSHLAGHEKNLFLVLLRDWLAHILLHWHEDWSGAKIQKFSFESVRDFAVFLLDSLKAELENGMEVFGDGVRAELRERVLSTPVTKGFLLGVLEKYLPDQMETFGKNVARMIAMVNAGTRGTEKRLDKLLKLMCVVAAVISISVDRCVYCSGDREAAFAGRSLSERWTHLGAHFPPSILPQAIESDDNRATDRHTPQKHTLWSMSDLHRYYTQDRRQKCQFCGFEFVEDAVEFWNENKNFPAILGSSHRWLCSKSGKLGLIPKEEQAVSRSGAVDLAAFQPGDLVGNLSKVLFSSLANHITCGDEGEMMVSAEMTARPFSPNRDQLASSARTQLGYSPDDLDAQLYAYPLEFDEPYRVLPFLWWIGGGQVQELNLLAFLAGDAAPDSRAHSGGAPHNRGWYLDRTRYEFAADYNLFVDFMRWCFPPCPEFLNMMVVEGANEGGLVWELPPNIASPPWPLTQNYVFLYDADRTGTLRCHVLQNYTKLMWILGYRFQKEPNRSDIFFFRYRSKMECPVNHASLAGKNIPARDNLGWLLLSAYWYLCCLGFAWEATELKYIVFDTDFRDSVWGTSVTEAECELLKQKWITPLEINQDDNRLGFFAGSIESRNRSLLPEHPEYKYVQINSNDPGGAATERMIWRLRWKFRQGPRMQKVFLEEKVQHMACLDWFQCRQLEPTHYPNTGRLEAPGVLIKQSVVSFFSLKSCYGPYNRAFSIFELPVHMVLAGNYEGGLSPYWVDVLVPVTKPEDRLSQQEAPLMTYFDSATIIKFWNRNPSKKKLFLDTLRDAILHHLGFRKRVHRADNPPHDSIQTWWQLGEICDFDAQEPHLAMHWMRRTWHPEHRLLLRLFRSMALWRAREQGREIVTQIIHHLWDAAENDKPLGDAVPLPDPLPLHSRWRILERFLAVARATVGVDDRPTRPGYGGVPAQGARRGMGGPYVFAPDDTPFPSGHTLMIPHEELEADKVPPEPAHDFQPPQGGTPDVSDEGGADVVMKEACPPLTKEQTAPGPQRRVVTRKTRSRPYAKTLPKGHLG